ncbi:MAG TPA: CHAT domain-containing tetratricopeptide repeat protein, partial [Steroidobacteraceae bacterium]|nr:CHAT domain-containing tetratricopeptide repeat protein [Steroidobacteraceae bacterium]
YGIGVNYYALGDRQRAREFLGRSLAIRTVALDSRGRMASLRALATLDAEQGRLEEALAYDREALGLAVAPPAIARIRIQQAAHAAAAGNPREAEALLDEILATDAKRDALVQGEALLQRAMVRRGTGRPQEAIADLTLARSPLHEFGSVMEEFEAELELARALRQEGNARGALGAVDRALAQSDAVRLQSANPELRAELQTPLRPAYDLKLDLLWDRYQLAIEAGHEGEAAALAAAAFATADAARARSFTEVATRSYSPAVRQALAPELRRREELYRELAARRFALDARLERSGSDDPRVRHLVADIAELRRQVDTVNTVIARRTAANGAPVRTRLQGPDVSALLGDTALLSYWLGSESAYGWVVSSREIHWVRLGAPDAIAAQAIAFHHSLTRLIDTPVERRLREGHSLYRAIIEPLESWTAGARNWIVVPDGALDYVAFPALPMRDSPQASFVVLEHDVAVAPAAWMLASGSRAPQRNGGILIVADPVYGRDDPRLGAGKALVPSTATASRRAGVDSEPAYQRLRFSAEEAVAISTQFAPAQVEELIGLDATRDRLLALDWSQYRFIHIATHGVVDAEVPDLSALILGSYGAHGEVADRAVRVADISVKTLNAEVAVLSACETALGTESRSEGLVGLGSTMLARGAHAVVASLWPVPDQMGARLMAEFYRHMLRDSLSPQAALGSAMRSMATGGPSADPALWGAFQVSVASLGGSAAAPRPAPVEFAGHGSGAGLR